LVTDGKIAAERLSAGSLRRWTRGRSRVTDGKIAVERLSVLSEETRSTIASSVTDGKIAAERLSVRGVAVTVAPNGRLQMERSRRSDCQTVITRAMDRPGIALQMERSRRSDCQTHTLNGRLLVRKVTDGKIAAERLSAAALLAR